MKYSSPWAGDRSNHRRFNSTGERLERFMFDHGWTKKRLARESGVAISTVYRVLGGDWVGDIETWHRLAETMGTTITELTETVDEEAAR